MRDVVFKGSSFKDFTNWLSEDKRVYLKIVELIEETRRTPYEGKGSPEALKYHLEGMWSRKINNEHRLVYKVEPEYIEIVSCKFHYSRF
jgi:toxin YoeB